MRLTKGVMKQKHCGNFYEKRKEKICLVKSYGMKVLLSLIHFYIIEHLKNEYQSNSQIYIKMSRTQPYTSSTKKDI